jgi:glycogen operon protein
MPKAQNKLAVVTITPGVVADAFTGSASLFQGALHNNRNSWNSVNYVDSHDGLTLKDLYSCNSPNNNQGYPFGPTTADPTTSAGTRTIPPRDSPPLSAGRRAPASPSSCCRRARQ